MLKDSGNDLHILSDCELLNDALSTAQDNQGQMGQENTKF
jgi:hypothetical protein